MCVLTHTRGSVPPGGTRFLTWVSAERMCYTIRYDDHIICSDLEKSSLEKFKLWMRKYRNIAIVGGIRIYTHGKKSVTGERNLIRLSTHCSKGESALRIKTIIYGLKHWTGWMIPQKPFRKTLHSRSFSRTRRHRRSVICMCVCACGGGVPFSWLVVRKYV